MQRAAIVFVALASLSTPSFATEWINCADDKAEASFNVLLGFGEVTSFVGATITAGEAFWTTDIAYGPGDPIIIGQSYEDAETIRVDVMDEDFDRKIAELRLFQSKGPDDIVFGGTMRIVGGKGWAVSCDGY